MKQTLGNWLLPQKWRVAIRLIVGGRVTFVFLFPNLIYVKEEVIHSHLDKFSNYSRFLVLHLCPFVTLLTAIHANNLHTVLSCLKSRAFNVWTSCVFWLVCFIVLKHMRYAQIDLFTEFCLIRSLICIIGDFMHYCTRNIYIYICMILLLYIQKIYFWRFTGLHVIVFPGTFSLM